MQGEAGSSSMSLGSASSTESTTCTVEADTVTHAFEIDGYSQFRALLAVGNSMRSTIFKVGGFDWAIRFYPNSTCVQLSNNVAVSLELISSNAEVSAHYSIQFMGGRDPKVDSMLTWLSATGASRLFRSSDRSGGRYRPRHMGYMLRSTLEDWFLVNDHLTIHCDLTVIRNPTLLVQNMGQQQTEIIPVPPSDFTMHFGKLLEDKKGADVTFVVEGQSFDAHKAVLAARSPVFMDKFFGSMTGEQGTGSVIIVEDMKPLVFKALLHFIYTDMLPEAFDPNLGHDADTVMITKILVAANTYAMDRLKLMCESILAKKLSIENVNEIVDIAHRHSGGKLRAACIEFLASLSEFDFTRASAKLIKRCDSSFMVAVFSRINRT